MCDAQIEAVLAGRALARREAKILQASPEELADIHRQAKAQDAETTLQPVYGEYERLVNEAMGMANTKKAKKIAKKAIALAPDRPKAYGVLAGAHMRAGERLRAMELFLEAETHCQPNSELWATAIHQAWAARGNAAPCGSGNVYCDCERCSVPPYTDKPAWMKTPESVAEIAERVIAAAPDHASAHRMHARALEASGNLSLLRRRRRARPAVEGAVPRGGPQVHRRAEKAVVP